MARVSVLLTCYNHLQFLAEAVESVRTQTFRDYEILAIDDGSTDGTREWLSAQAGIICVFNEKNLGTYASLNRGFEKATGEFIAILNDDDVWESEKLAKQVELLDSDASIGIVGTGGKFIDDQGKQRLDNPLGFAYPVFETGDILADLVYSNRFITSAVMFRAECLHRTGSFNSLFFGTGDWEKWWQICEQYRAGFVPDSLTSYRIHSNQASKNMQRIWEDDERLRLYFADRLLDLADRFPPATHFKARAFNYAALGQVQQNLGKISLARLNLSRSIQCDRTRWKTYLRFLATYLPSGAKR